MFEFFGINEFLEISIDFIRYLEIFRLTNRWICSSELCGKIKRPVVAGDYIIKQDG